MKPLKLISVCLLLALSVSMSACGPDSVSTDTEDNTEAATEALPAGIEKCDYENEPLKIIAPDWGLYRHFFFSDGEQSDPMDKAIYTRELLTEEHLGIDITYEYYGAIENILTEMTQLVMSGDDTFQLALTHCISNVSALVTEEYLYDFNDFEYVNLEADWWNSSIIENLALKGKNFYAVSDFMLPDPNCILFNKDFIDIYSLENPYELVREGEWTLDKMMEMMSVVTEDNGNGTWGKEDRWGFANPNDWLTGSFIYSSGITLCNINNEGEFELSFGDERTYTLMEKLDKLINGPDTYNFRSPEYDPSNPATMYISDNRALFALASVNWLSYFRETEVNYGILPYPKLDEAQENYSNNDWSGLMCVPKTVQNPEMIGKAIELLAYHSETTTIPAYFDIMLGAKLSRDADSVEMLNIIFDSMVYDAGFNFLGFSPNMSSLFYTPNLHIVKGGQNNFASWLNRYKIGAEAELKALNDTIAALD